MSKTVTDEELLKLWRNPAFSGSYVGIKSFVLLLKTDLDIDISEKRAYKVLHRDPIYLMHKRPIRNYARRFYYITYYGELLQMDIAQMYEYDSYNCFLLVVDVFR